MPIESIDPWRCTGCGECIRQCHADIIRLEPLLLENETRHRAVAKYPQDCDGCGLCITVCPRECISFEKVNFVVSFDPRPIGRRFEYKEIHPFVLLEGEK